ncbi:MAG: GNAT family N-acetyltransferase [Flavobacteriia bacterium]|nr:GNAT family N-acetyltransferase [Flavobacteriia bacterium]
MSHTNLVIKDWDSLSKEELYAILRIRQEVFVVEQHCPYLDLDDHDQSSYHLIMTDDEGIIAYTRLLPPGQIYKEPSIGRVITAERARRKGIGREAMDASMKFVLDNWGEPIRIMAQSYLLKFYESYGFVKEGEEFLEDGLPHWYMVCRRREVGT